VHQASDTTRYRITVAGRAARQGRKRKAGQGRKPDAPSALVSSPISPS